MNHKMHLIFITRPEVFDGETALCNAMLRAGLERLHLRKPGASREALAAWIGEIDPSLRRRIIVHDHHELARDYGLGGIHLNRRNPEVPQWLDHNHLSVSRSCHSIDEVRQYSTTCDYLTLSPIYDSISKEGYGAAFSREELAQAKAEGLLGGNVYALGGVSFERLDEVQSLGFYGAALLGAVWNAPKAAMAYL